jgi:hypothetical protein
LAPAARAVDNWDRSSSSSDPGSAIEGFGQKISLHNELTNLRVKLLKVQAERPKAIAEFSFNLLKCEVLMIFTSPFERRYSRIWAL